MPFYRKPRAVKISQPSRAEILEKLKDNIASLMKAFSDPGVHVDFFTRDLLEQVRLFYAAIPSSKAEEEHQTLRRVIGQYADYLSINICNMATTNDKPYLTIQNCLFLMKAISQYNEKYTFSNELLKCFTMLSYYWLTKKQNNPVFTKYSIGMFYQVCKLMRDTNYSKHFFDIKISHRLTLKINDLFSRTVNSQTELFSIEIVLLFLGLGYLSQQGRLFNILPKTMRKVEGIWIKASLNSQSIANVFLSMGYIVQARGEYPLSESITKMFLCRLVTLQPNIQEIANVFFTFGIMAQAQKIQNPNEIFPFLVQLREQFFKHLRADKRIYAVKSDVTDHRFMPETSQILIAHYRFKYFLNLTLLDDHEVRYFESIQEKPKPNIFQQSLFNILKEFREKVVLEMLVCGYPVDVCLPDKKIIIEIDGEQHFDQNCLSAVDCFRNELLEKAGYNVFHIKNSDLNVENQHGELYKHVEGIFKRCGYSIPTSTVAVSNNPACFLAAKTPSTTNTSSSVPALTS